VAENKRITKTIEKKSSGNRLSTVRKGKKERNIEEEFSRLYKLNSLIPVKTYNVTLKQGTAKGAKGILYVSHNHICFSADVFGRKVKSKYAFGLIRDLQLNDNKIELLLPNTQVVIKDFENIQEAFSNILEQSKQNKDTTEDYVEEEKTEEGEDSNLAPSNSEWDQILEGTRSMHFQKNEYVILQSNPQPQRLYQIAKGSCRIEMVLDGQTIVFGVITTQDSMFGEISFLEGVGGKATASVVANEPETVVRVIEGYYLNILFEYNPGLAGRFYHYLGQVLSKRLKIREATAQNKKEEDESEVDDERSETDNRRDSTSETFTVEKESKKNPVKRTKDLEKKVKKRRKSSNRIVVEGKPSGKEEEEKETKKEEKEKKK